MQPALHDLLVSDGLRPLADERLPAMEARLAEFRSVARHGAQMNLSAARAIGQAISIMRQVQSEAG